MSDKKSKVVLKREPTETTDDIPSSSKKSNWEKGSSGAPESSSSKPARLPSIAEPRDLTLGGVKKRQFVPNLNAKKTKAKKKSESSTKQTTKPKQSVKPKKKEFIRKQAIQSTSIFEAGSGAPKTHRNDFRSPSMRSGPSESKIASLNRVTAQLRSSAPHKGAGDSEADVRQENLPLEELLKQIDMEGDTCISDIGNQSCFLEDVHNEQSSHHEIGIPSILEEGSMERLIEFKLPDKLPSQPIAPASKHEHHDSGNQNEGECEEIGEGYLGKIQVLQSGRCQLIIGNHTLEIDRSVVSNSYKEAVVIRPHETRDKGTFTRVGQIAHALDCYPTIDQI